MKLDGRDPDQNKRLSVAEQVLTLTLSLVKIVFKESSPFLSTCSWDHTTYSLS